MEETGAKETLSAAEVKSACGAEEEQGFDAPFATYTWKHWIDMQTTIVKCLTRYQRAIEAHQALTATMVVLDLQEVAAEMLKEAAAWIGVPERE